jgi:hypothetical protein
VVIPAGYAQANFVYTGSAVPTGAEWTLGLDISGVAGTPLAVATLLETAYTAAGFTSHIATNCNLSFIEVKFGPDSTGPSATLSVSFTSSGGTGVGPNTSWLVQKLTLDGGRAGRGRAYVPGVPESSNGESGNLLNADVAALQTDFDQFQTSIEGNDLYGMVLHGAASPLEVPSLITAFQVDDVSATQRRRLRR